MVDIRPVKTYIKNDCLYMFYTFVYSCLFPEHHFSSVKSWITSLESCQVRLCGEHEKGPVFCLGQFLFESPITKNHSLPTGHYRPMCSVDMGFSGCCLLAIHLGRIGSFVCRISKIDHVWFIWNVYPGNKPNIAPYTPTMALHPACVSARKCNTWRLFAFGFHGFLSVMSARD